MIACELKAEYTIERTLALPEKGFLERHLDKYHFWFSSWCKKIRKKIGLYSYTDELSDIMTEEIKQSIDEEILRQINCLGSSAVLEQAATNGQVGGSIPSRGSKQVVLV